MANDAIKTRPITPEYAEGFDHAYGLERPTRRPGRTVYVFRDGKLVEVGGDYEPTPRPPVFGDSHYDNLRAVDGTDISSRTKHRDYMKRNGLTTVDDYRDTWRKAADERAATERLDSRARKEAIGRAIYDLEKKGAR